MSVRRRVSAVLLRACTLLLLAGVARANSPALHQRATDAVRSALATNASPGVALLDSTLLGHRLTLNFSRGLLDLTPGSLAFERWSRAIHVAAAETLHGELDEFEIHTLIAGVPLHQLLGPADPSPVAQLMAPPLAGSTPARQALVGRRVALSPGHGYYLNASSRWVLQRDFFSGIVEDFVNHDFISQVERLLVGGGADVRPTRNLDRNAGFGESGFPKWQEAARYHAKALGAADSVWNEAGLDHLSQDIRCRPLYANAVGAELLVSIHNNGGGGTGTETLYDTNHSAAAESKRLADLLHARVIAAIRRDYNPTWADRRVQGFNGNYGENRLATRPAVIIEIAFMDRPTPDNEALRDERFKRIVAAAIADGIREFVEGPVPAPPSGLAATSEVGAVTLAWSDNATNETGYRVQRSDSNTVGWTTIATLPAGATSYRDAAIFLTETYTYRVQAFNAAGASGQSSNEVTLGSLPRDTTLRFLGNPPPVASFTLNWEQGIGFDFIVSDAGSLAIPGATATVRDPFRNTTVVTVSDSAGHVRYSVGVPHGQATGSYEFEFQVTKPGFTPAPLLRRTIVVNNQFAGSNTPEISRQPAPLTVTAGGSATFSVAATGAAPVLFFPPYQWQRDGAPIAGATAATYALANVTTADAGRYRVVVRNSNGTATSLEAVLTVQPTAWLSNVSVRTTLAAGQNVIVGFSLPPPGKPLLVRAAGPALSAFGLTTAMADPRLEMFIGQALLAQNNDWPATLAPVFTGVGAFAFPAASRDAAVLQSMFGAGTAIVTGTAGGVVLVEGYDAGTGSAVRLLNLSARNRVGTGSDILIAGFVIAGTGTQRVLIRAIGPSLAAFGVTGTLIDPKLEVHDATGRIAENDNWAPALAPTFTQVGAFPLAANSRDSALLLTLTAGRSYTAQISGIGATTGEALVEVYEVP